MICTSCIDSIITIKHKMHIKNVIHQFEKNCVFRVKKRLKIHLFKRNVVAITVLKKIHEKSVSALMNLIQEI